MGKIVKFSKGFQTHIAAAMCRDSFVMDRLYPLVSSDIFDDAQVGDIIAFMRAHYVEHKELLTKRSLFETFEDVEAKNVIKSLWKEDVKDKKFVVENVIDFVRQQHVEKAITACAMQIDQGKHDGIVNIMREALSVGEDLTDIGEFFHDDFDTRTIDYRRPELVNRLRTGLSHLDECLNGGLEPGELGVILAPPKTGKSFMLVNMGVGAATGIDGVNVVHYSLEMSQRNIQKRYDKRVAGRKILIHKESDPNQFIEKLRTRKKRIIGGEILVKGYRTRGATVSTLRAHLTNLKAMGFNFGVVIVDYGDIMRPERRLGEARHEQAGIYEDLRALGQEFNVPVWTASQANRGSLNKEIVTMADVAESFEKIAIADAVVALCRTDEEKRTDEGRLFIAALREEKMSRVIECSFMLGHATIRTLRINDSADALDGKKRKGKKTEGEREKIRERATLNKLSKR